jgi:hypothetical protein
MKRRLKIVWNWSVIILAPPPFWAIGNCVWRCESNGPQRLILCAIVALTAVVTVLNGVHEGLLIHLDGMKQGDS